MEQCRNFIIMFLLFFYSSFLHFDVNFSLMTTIKVL